MKNWQEIYRENIQSFSGLIQFIQENHSSSDFCEELKLDESVLYPLLLPTQFVDDIMRSPESLVLQKQFFPNQREQSSQGLNDPIGDLKHSKGHGIIHRYENRLLFTPTKNCPVLCRYCFRKNELMQNPDKMFAPSLNYLMDYLKSRPEVNEVILTGGDPLILSNSKIRILLEHLKGRVDFVRFHSRTPIIIPQRLDQGLIELINSYAHNFKQISFAFHINHVAEIKLPDRYQFISNFIKKTDALFLSQSVLLKEINDNIDALRDLYQSFHQLGLRAYYLHHPDQTIGTEGFQIDKSKGIELMRGLRQLLPGWMLPRYVLDSEAGKTENFVP